MRTTARTPIAALILTLCALVAAALVITGTQPAGAAGGGVCPNQIAPPPPVDTSERPAPGQQPPAAVPVPDNPVGGARLAGCGVLLPPGAPNPPGDIGFDSWVIQDVDSGAVLAAKDPHARERPASLIKLLLALVVARQLNPDQVIIGTQDDANQEGTRVGIGPGGQYPVSLLVHGLLMASGNDIAHALAMAVGGMQAAVDKMNALAKQLGALDTRAATPSGLDGPGMSTSAYDLSLIFRAALANPLIADAVHTPRLQFPGYGGKPPFTVNNDNQLLTRYPGDLGGKTGYTDDAQHTYANAAVQNGHRIALIMMHGTNHLEGMYQNANELMNYGFALVNAHTAAIGQLVAAGPTAATSALGNGATHLAQGHPGGAADPTAGTSQPVPAMSAFGNVGGGLTALAAVALVLIAVLAIRRQRAKVAREKARLAKRKAERDAALAPTVRVRPLLADRPKPPPMPTRPPQPRQSPSLGSTATSMTGPIWPTHDQN